MGKGKATRKKKASQVNTERHKAERKARHEKRLEKFEELKITRDALLEKAKEITKLGSVGLGKMIGTLNIARLSAVVENRYLTAPWYLSRQKKTEEKSNAKKTVEVKEILARINETKSLDSKSKKKNPKRQNERVPKG
jgi:hypothetical protein